jgi:redox-sensing transcriptional repressor
MVLYVRCLRKAYAEGVVTLSSADIEARTGINSGQIRKDLSYFGEFGKPGLGYGVTPLLTKLSRIMQLDRVQPVLLVGAGNLGTALAGYTGLRDPGLQLVAIYDSDPQKIGRRIWEIEIIDIACMPTVNAVQEARLGIITVPAGAAQAVADQMVASGVQAILNFAPARVSVPPGVMVRNVDLTQELQILCYYLPGGHTETVVDARAPKAEE